MPPTQAQVQALLVAQQQQQRALQQRQQQQNFAATQGIGMQHNPQLSVLADLVRNGKMSADQFQMIAASLQQQQPRPQQPNQQPPPQQQQQFFSAPTPPQPPRLPTPNSGNPSSAPSPSSDRIPYAILHPHMMALQNARILQQKASVSLNTLKEASTPNSKISLSPDERARLTKDVEESKCVPSSYDLVSSGLNFSPLSQAVPTASHAADSTVPSRMGANEDRGRLDILQSAS